MRALAAVLTAIGILATATSARGVRPGYEANNYSKINERAANDYTPAFNLLLAQEGLANQAAAASITASDGPAQREYGRDFSGDLYSEPNERVRRRRRASTTGARRATGSSSRSCSPHATARRSRAMCGGPRPGRRSAPAS